MITVLFFAKYRELLKTESLQLNAVDGMTIQSLIEDLKNKGADWQVVFNQQNLLIAKNQQMSHLAATLTPGDEVGFFPPVTGG